MYHDNKKLINFIKTFGIGIFISIFITIYFTFVSFASTPNIFGNNNDFILDSKIVIVNSYNINHPCSAPQDEGFRTEISKYKNLNVNIVMYDLFTKTKNITDIDQEIISTKIIKKIKNINPDVIYTTDDNAFRLVGIPLSNKYTVIASGLNKDPRSYISEYHLNKDKNNIYFISETIRLDMLWNILDKSNINISHVYIISESNKNSSVTNYYMTQNYINEIKGRLDYSIIYVKYVSEFRRVILKLNKHDDSLIILSLQRLIDDNGKYINKLDIIKELLDTNYTNLELCGNFVFCKEGAAICIMPDFWNMGKISADITAKIIMHKYLKNNNINIPENFSIIIPANKISINKARLDQLGYTNILKNDRIFYKIFDKFYNMKNDGD